MRILVTGSRELTDRALIQDEIAEVVVDYVLANDDDGYTPHTVVVGDCPTGADLFAREFWQQIITDGYNPETQEHLDVHKADWATHGKAAGPLRNQAMVDSGADICLAFLKVGAGNRGTNDCVRRARAAGIPVKLFQEPA